MIAAIILLQLFFDFPSDSSAAPLQKYGWRPTLGNDTALFESQAPSWVSEPQYRGTWGIIYSCTLTIILTVYKSLHMNIPAPDEGYQLYVRGLKWALIALIAPEFVLMYAFVQWHEAIRLCADLEKLIPKENPDDSPQTDIAKDTSSEQSCARESQIDLEKSTSSQQLHTRKESYESLLPDAKSAPSTDSDAQSIDSTAKGGIFLDPGVWVSLLTSPLKFSLPSAPFQGLTLSLAGPASEHFPLKYGFYVGMGGFAVDTTKLYPIGQLTMSPRVIFPHDRAAVTASGVLALARRGRFLKLKAETISDKSKADTLAKILAIFQVSWLVVETSARKANGVPISLLEIHTLVHVFCALVMYCFWLKKPVGIKDPVIIEEEDAKVVWEEHHRRISSRRSSYPPRVFSWKLVRRTSSRYEDAISPRAYGTPHIVYDFGLSEYLIIRGLMVVVAAAYGGVHLAAWSFDLPTKIESYVWKASCIIMLVSSLPMPLWSLMGNLMFYQDLSVWGAVKRLHETIWSPFPRDGLRLVVCVVLYVYFVFSLILLPLCISARVAIILESFICLRQVPQGVYLKVSWTQYIPHI